MKAIVYTKYGPPEVLLQRDAPQHKEIENLAPKRMKCS
jgi:hypothetical protein